MFVYCCKQKQIMPVILTFLIELSVQPD
jgi:hypothetical protein